jgi:hypothetical protein
MSLSIPSKELLNSNPPIRIRVDRPHLNLVLRYNLQLTTLQELKQKIAEEIGIIPQEELIKYIYTCIVPGKAFFTLFDQEATTKNDNNTLESLGIVAECTIYATAPKSVNGFLEQRSLPMPKKITLNAEAKQLKSMFPQLSDDIVKEALDSAGNNVEKAAAQLLNNSGFSSGFDFGGDKSNKPNIKRVVTTTEIRQVKNLLPHLTDELIRDTLSACDNDVQRCIEVFMPKSSANPNAVKRIQNLLGTTFPQKEIEEALLKNKNNEEETVIQLLALQEEKKQQDKDKESLDQLKKATDDLQKELLSGKDKGKSAEEAEKKLADTSNKDTSNNNSSSNENAKDSSVEQQNKPKEDSASNAIKKEAIFDVKSVAVTSEEKEAKKKEQVVLDNPFGQESSLTQLVVDPAAEFAALLRSKSEDIEQKLADQKSKESENPSEKSQQKLEQQKPKDAENPKEIEVPVFKFEPFSFTDPKILQMKEISPDADLVTLENILALHKGNVNEAIETLLAQGNVAANKQPNTNSNNDQNKANSDAKNNNTNSSSDKKDEKKYSDVGIPLEDGVILFKSFLSFSQAIELYNRCTEFEEEISLDRSKLILSRLGSGHKPAVLLDNNWYHNQKRNIDPQQTKFLIDTAVKLFRQAKGINPVELQEGYDNDLSAYRSKTNSAEKCFTFFPTELSTLLYTENTDLPMHRDSSTGWVLGISIGCSADFFWQRNSKEKRNTVRLESGDMILYNGTTLLHGISKVYPEESASKEWRQIQDLAKKESNHPIIPVRFVVQFRDLNVDSSSSNSDAARFATNSTKAKKTKNGAEAEDEDNGNLFD